MAISLVKKTFEALEKQGCFPAVTETFNFFSKRKNDLYTIFDLVAIDPNTTGITGYQVTSRTNISTRRHKIKESSIYQPWLAAGNKIYVYGWFKNASKRWDVKIEEITLDDPMHIAMREGKPTIVDFFPATPD